MDVTLRFTDLNIIRDLEFEARGVRGAFTNEIQYKVITIHELLFGFVKIFLKSKGLFSRTYFREIAIFRNIDITEEEGELKIPIKENSDLEQKELTVKYTAKETNHEDCENEIFDDPIDLLGGLFSSDYYLKVSSGVKIIYSTITDFRMDMISSIYYSDKYFNKKSEKINLNNEENMNVCVVRPYMGQNDSQDELEDFLFHGKYKYDIISVQEYLKNKEKYDMGNYNYRNVSTNKSFEETFIDEMSIDEFFDYLKELIRLNCIPLLNVHDHIKPKSTSLTPIDSLMSNEGYIIAHHTLIRELLNMLSFAVAPNGSLHQLSKIKQNEIINPEIVPDIKRREILECLGIKDNMLLCVSLNDNSQPGFIIFYDEIKNRIVISFKDITSIKDIVHIVDILYVGFYEGFGHRGFIKLAIEFINNNIGLVIEHLKRFKTKDLLLTGYSLGAGVASIVSIILKRQNILPGCKITTFVFSSPPVVSYDLTNVENTFNINYENDPIPRMSYGSLEEFLYIFNSSGLSEKDKLDSLRHKGQMYPKLYHLGKVYHLKRVRDDSKSYLLYKKVDLEFFENFLFTRDSPIHHQFNHLASVFEECLNLRECFFSMDYF